MVEGWWSFRAGAEQEVLGYDKHTDDVKPAAMGVDWAKLGRPYWHEAGHDWFETPPLEGRSDGSGTRSKLGQQVVSRFPVSRG